MHPNRRAVDVGGDEVGVEILDGEVEGGERGFGDFGCDYLTPSAIRVLQQIACHQIGRIDPGAPRAISPVDGSFRKAGIPERCLKSRFQRARRYLVLRLFQKRHCQAVVVHLLRRALGPLGKIGVGQV